MGAIGISAHSAGVVVIASSSTVEAITSTPVVSEASTILEATSASTIVIAAPEIVLHRIEASVVKVLVVATVKVGRTILKAVRSRRNSRRSAHCVHTLAFGDGLKGQQGIVTIWGSRSSWSPWAK